MKQILLLLIISTIIYAHSGRADSSGGHTNRKTGSYHYHTKVYKQQSSYKKLNSTSFSCGQKRYCYEMNSCSEVMFYFNKCGLSRLDGDKDGIPCEKLCK